MADAFFAHKPAIGRFLAKASQATTQIEAGDGVNGLDTAVCVYNNAVIGRLRIGSRDSGEQPFALQGFDEFGLLAGFQEGNGRS